MLERDLADMCAKLPLFFTSVLLLSVALLQLCPASSVADIHARIITQFRLDSLTSSPIRGVADIYSYMADFEQHNEEVQATSMKYWCESRYATHYWDAELGVPRWACASPRQYALGDSTDASWSWTSLNGYGRRLGSPPACEDDDAALQNETGAAGATCSGSPSVCDSLLGPMLCPLSCGMCAPWQYNRTARFNWPQVTMLPAMVYQTRFSPGDCRGFASVYNEQRSNPALWVLPPLDGAKHGDVLACVDRSRPLEDDFAHRVPDPDGGETPVTPKHSFLGKTVYPDLLLSPARTIQTMQAVQWLDGQTDTLALGTMIYTEGIEVFTSLSVEFVFNQVGTVTPSYTLVSYRDLISGVKTTFVVCLSLAAVCALLGVILSVFTLCQDRAQCKLGLVFFELCSRSALLVFAFVLLISWGQQSSKSEEYDSLLHTFLDMQGTAAEDVKTAMQGYFDVKAQIYSDTSWLQRMKLAAYLVLYMQFAQLLLYLSAHPKLGVLTSTISRAAGHLANFLILFWLTFLSLAFVAHWMLGEYVPAFSTFGGAVESQARMLYGEFIYAGGAEFLTSGYTAVYWLYAGTYMCVVFFLLLNFFLAIIVDAFVDVKSGFETSPAILHGFLTDLLWVTAAALRWRRGRWPPRSKILEVLGSELDQAGAEDAVATWVKRLSAQDAEAPAEEGEPPQKAMTITAARLMDAVPGLTEDKLAELLHHYFSMSSRFLCKNLGDLV
ncbi:unnamed protein product [Prorocentrum cordatum]|nr:unnamed protein product [Polarella glacialis]